VTEIVAGVGENGGGSSTKFGLLGARGEMGVGRGVVGVKGVSGVLYIGREVERPSRKTRRRRPAERLAENAGLDEIAREREGIGSGVLIYCRGGAPGRGEGRGARFPRLAERGGGQRSGTNA
jgi:hypothetical protein